MAHDAVMISDLSDTELDAVTGGTWGSSRTTTNNINNVAVAQAAANNQVNVAVLSNARQGGNQNNTQSVYVG